MSGIYGIVNFDGQVVDLIDLERMARTMAHRGPDASNTWLENNVGFGQLMLCSTPESLDEKLPWKDPLSGLLITADARIDNRGDLIAALSISPTLEPSISDSQLILAAFRKWGEACVDHLLGDFSFAIWDSMNRSLFVARDHMGIRPFYYCCCEDFFVFASAANAIPRVSRVPKQINEGRVGDFLIQELEGINNTSTFFQNIYRMPPAHFGLVGKNKISFHRYWKPDPEIHLQLRSDDDYADALEDALTAAVKARLRSHRPVSSMLSGGVDSSAISGIAGKISKINGDGPFRTYSGISDDVTNCCETRFINMMINHGGLDPVLVSPAQIKNHLSDFERTSEFQEDPFGDSWTMLRLIYLSAREHRNVAVLDGMGGDLVAGITTGYPSYLLRRGEIKHAFREIRGLRINFYELEISRMKAYSQAIRPVIIPNSLRRLKVLLGPGNEAEINLTDSMLSKEFVSRINMVERRKEYNGQFPLGFCPSLRHRHAETLLAPFLTAAIERYERLASYSGIETRQPFHDKRVVELCLSLPWQQKAQNGWLKFCLRNVLQRVAPKEVAWRSQFDSVMGKFSVAWNEMNRENNLSTIAAGREQLLEIVDKKQLDKILKRDSKSAAVAVEPIANLATLLNWLQKNQAI